MFDMVSEITVRGKTYEAIAGQDHEWWLFDDRTGLFYPTGYSWNRVGGTELQKLMEKDGVGGTWLDIDYDI